VRNQSPKAGLRIALAWKSTGRISFVGYRPDLGRARVSSSELHPTRIPSHGTPFNRKSLFETHPGSAWPLPDDFQTSHECTPQGSSFMNGPRSIRRVGLGGSPPRPKCAEGNYAARTTSSASATIRELRNGDSPCLVTRSTLRPRRVSSNSERARKRSQVLAPGKNYTRRDRRHCRDALLPRSTEPNSPRRRRPSVRMSAPTPPAAR
jgi:hypothetical protein